VAVGEPASTSWRWEAKECAKVYEFCTTGTDGPAFTGQSLQIFDRSWRSVTSNVIFGKHNLSTAIASGTNVKEISLNFKQFVTVCVRFLVGYIKRLLQG